MWGWLVEPVVGRGTWSWIVPGGLWEIAEPLIPPSKVRPQGSGTQGTFVETLFAAIMYVLVGAAVTDPVGLGQGAVQQQVPRVRRPQRRGQAGCLASQECDNSIRIGVSGAHADPGTAAIWGVPFLPGLLQKVSHRG